MTHECFQEENVGKFKEFMNSTKGMRPQITMITFAIVIQVVSFAYLWGKMEMRVGSTEEKIKALCSKLDNVKLIGYVHAKDLDKEVR